MSIKRTQPNSVFRTRLIAGIENYSVEIKRVNPQAFIYNGIDMEPAIDRFLWFKYDREEYPTQNPHVRKIYKLYSEGGVRSFTVNNLIEKHLAQYIVADPSVIFQIKETSNSRNIGKNILLNELGIFRLKDTLSKRKMQGAALAQLSEISKVKADILVMVTSVRFIRFTLPIFQGLGLKVAYFTTEKYLTDEEVRKVLPIEFGFFRCHLIWNLIKDEGNNFLRKNYLELVNRAFTLEKVFSLIKPKAVVNVEGNLAADALAAEIGKKLNIKTVCFQQGWAPIIHNGFRKLNYDHFLTWGDGFSQILKEYSLKGKFNSLGNFTISPNLKAGSQQIDSIAFFFQTVDTMLTKDVYDSFVEFGLKLAAQYEGKKIIFRPHPNYPFTETQYQEFGKYSNLIIMKPFETSLEEVLQVSDIGVSVFSSTLVECACSNVIPLIFNPLVIEEFIPDMVSMKAGLMVNSVEDGIATIEKLLKTNDDLYELYQGMSRFRELYFESTGSLALSNYKNFFLKNIGNS